MLQNVTFCYVFGFFAVDRVIGERGDWPFWRWGRILLVAGHAVWSAGFGALGGQLPGSGGRRLGEPLLSGQNRVAVTGGCWLPVIFLYYGLRVFPF
jgi:hypothetical protein